MFDFVDLFAGVGGFHAALEHLGGRGVLASEVDPAAAKVYRQNWGLDPAGDVRDLAHDPVTFVPDHAVLAAGFPCQPFSKSGRQRGIGEDRGTLFHDLLEIVQAKTPPVVVLENVRNIAGPRQVAAWNAIIKGLRDAGYLVSETPLVFSPHLLSPEDGGAAQVRDRVYILGVQVGRDRARKETDVEPALRREPQNGWEPSRWRIEEHVLLSEPGPMERHRFALDADETRWIDIWNELLGRLGSHVRLPGFPMWEPMWRARRPRGYPSMPGWKQRFVEKNRHFYLDNRREIDAWRRQPRAVPIDRLPLSRRKLEWQAQDAPRDLWKLLIQLRPSGIRVKQPTWTPALVAMNQTSIYGPGRRRLTPLETARLQGFDPETFTFGDQPDAVSYKQMGNAVNARTAAYVIRRFIEANRDDVCATGRTGEALAGAVLSTRG